MDSLHSLMSDAENKRALIRRKTLEGLKDIFPIIGKNHRLELEELRVKDKHYSSNEQKDAILRGGTLHEPIVGTLVMKTHDGQVVDTLKNHTMAHLPYFTERHTFIVGGNEYDIPNQLRLKPGVYTRERANGEYEAAFNLSKGDNFRLSMEPESGKLHMELHSSKIPLYPLLRSLGVPDEKVRHYWGDALHGVNAARGTDKEESVLNKVIGKVLRSDETTPATIEAKREYVQKYFANTGLDPAVTERTLGIAATSASPLAMLTASKKLIDVHKKDAAPDDRDSLEFKTVHSVDDFFKERLSKDAKRTIGRKIQQKMNLHAASGISKFVPHSAFSKSLNTFLTSSDLSSIPMQINPIEIIDHASRITSLGEGGIGSERAIPFESRKIHNTHLGVLDIVRTPETGRTGIDVRASMASYKDDNGNLYTRMRNARTGEIEHVNTTTLAKSVVAFPGHHKNDTHWDAIKGTDIVSVPKHEVDYVVDHAMHMFGPTTALVPLISTMQGNRAIMGSKFQTQAVPLIHREAPYVQVGAARHGESMESEMARLIVPTARVDGTIHKIDRDYIYIKPDAKQAAAATGDEGLIKVPYDTYFPLSSKTHLHNEVKVKVGDRVKKDQTLAESNFTRNGVLALGKNLSVGYMAYHGKNSNDAVVISEGAAHKLTAEHMYKEILPKSSDVLTGKDKYVAYYGNRFTKAQLDKLDDDGVAKPGQTFQYGDPLILGLRKAPPTPEAALLGNLHKSLVKPYRDGAVTWDHGVPGFAQEGINAARQTTVTMRTHEPMKIGDKLANRFGGKGVVSEIIPDEHMVKDEGGKPIDILFSSNTVVSRVNPGQIVEAALGKVAEKTGKPIIMPQFLPDDHVAYAKKLLEQHGVKDKETVYDPRAGKHIPDIFVGRSTIFRLFKNTETNYSARGVAGYDVNMQPTRGGDEGAKGLGRMEINTLLAHNARNVLKEGLTVKSDKNDEFWRSFEFGLPPPPVKTPFVTDKFVSMLKAAGINVNKDGTHVVLGPVTDKEVTKLSSGALEVPSLDKSKSFMVSAKNMKPEKGGLFDPVLTGGLSGTRWAHMDLAEPILNPIFEEPARRLLGMTGKQIDDALAVHGGHGIKKQLNAIDLDDREKTLLEHTKTKRGADLDNAVKQLKYIRALKAAGHTKAGDAYVLSKIPVIPPVMRPILPSNRGNELQVADLNYLYRDVGLASEALRSVADVGLPTATEEARRHLYESTGALFGLREPTSPQLQGRQAKGLIEQITGSGSPKMGYFHRKILKRQQDLSGRATATPDNTLGMDQIGVPEDMLWTTYNKFIMRGLIGQGHKPTQAAEMVENRHPLAKSVLDQELTYRPMFVNRAPSLHKHNMVAAYAVPVQGKSLRVNPFMERGQNLDYDGDTMQLHVPIGPKAVAEAQKLTLSNLLFADKNRDDLMIFPQHEAIMGVFMGSQDAASGHTHKFKTTAEAMAAYKANKIKLNTPVEIG